MTTLGEAFVPIRATLDKLDKDLAGARGKIQGALSGIGKTVGNIGKVALTGIVGGIVAIGGAAALAGPQIIGLGADANETASLLETSLGDTADDLNDRLRTFADDANRSFYELQAGSATFVAMTRAMGATEDQAADLSGNFVEMATDLGSFFNVATEDALLDIQSALAGSSETMTKYGVDIRETTLKQMALDQGLIKSASETLPQLMRAQLIEQAIMEQSADAMGDAIRTSDSWSNTMRGLTGRLRDVATQAGQKLIPALQPMLTLLGDLAERAVPWLEQGLDKLIPIIENISSFVRSFVNNLSEGMSPLDAFIEAIWDLAPPAFLDFLVDLRDNILPSLIAKITEIVTPIQEWIAKNVELNDVLIGLGLLFGAVIIPAIWAIVAPILAVVAVGAILVAAVALIRNAWESNWGGIQEKTAAVVEFIRNLITTVMTGIQEFWAANGEAIMAKATEIWEGIKTAVAVAIEFVRTIVTEVATGLQEFWAEHGEAIMKSAEEAWLFIQESVETAIAVIKEVFAAFKSAFEGDWEAFGENLRDAWDTAWERISELLSSAKDTIIEIVAGLILDMIANFQDTDWGQLAQDVIDGIVQGLANGAAAVVAKMQEIGQAAYDAWQGFWNSNSPSKLAMEGAGDVTGGFLLQWDRDEIALERAASKLGQAAYAGLFGGSGLLAGGDSRGTNYNINAYYPYQEERSLRDDIKLLQLLTNG